MEYGYRLMVYKKDRRTKDGWKLVESKEYPDYSAYAMHNEIHSLSRSSYKAEAGFALDFEPLTVLVKNKMTGDMVMIDYRDRGGPCDPSTDRYWSM